MLDVIILNPQTIVFEGRANNVIMPGEQGVFEVMTGHKRILSRLLTGNIRIDNKDYPVRRGIVRVNKNKVTIIIEK